MEKILTIVELDVADSKKHVGVLEKGWGGEPQDTRIFYGKLNDFVRKSFATVIPENHRSKYEIFQHFQGDAFRVSFEIPMNAYSFVKRLCEDLEEYSKKNPDNKKLLFHMAAATGKVNFGLLNSEYDPNKIMGDTVLRRSSRLLKAAEAGWFYIDENTYNNLLTYLSKDFKSRKVKLNYNTEIDAWVCCLMKTFDTSTETSDKQRGQYQKANPFIPITGKIEDPKYFFPRERELNKIFEHLNNGSSVVLIGEEGIGKSSLLWATGYQSKNLLKQPRKAIFFDLNEIDNNEDDFYSTFCHEIGIPDIRRTKLNRNIRGKRILLAIDNVGKLARDGFTRTIRDKLRTWAEGMDSPLRLVLAASEPLEDLFQDSHNTSPLAGICQVEEISLWDEVTIREFIASRLQNTTLSNFKKEDIIRLINESNGHPRKLMKLCYDTYKQYMNI